MSFFSDNDGVCPECSSKLIFSAPSCVNWQCKLCTIERKRNAEFNMRIANRKIHYGIELLISDCFKEEHDKKKRNLQTNLDKA